MKNVQTQIVEKIKEYSKIVILRHVKPDPDALGSQGGLQKMIQSSFPDKNVFVLGEEVDSLKFINKMDTISKEEYEGALVIVCDTANIERISNKEIIESASYVIKIDHHPDREQYGDISWVDTSFSSTCEMIMDLYVNNLDSLFLNNAGARLLYTGIIGDTGRFLYDNTTSRTFKYASQLIEHFQFDPQEIYEQLYKTTRNTARLKGKILLDYELTEQGVAYFKVTKDILEEFKTNEDEAANLVNTLKDIEGNKVWVFFVESDDKIRVRIRSAKTHIDKVAMQFNGGGHPLASGATVYTWKEAQELIVSLNKIFTE